MLLFKVSYTNNAPIFFKLISRNPEDVKTFCNDFNNPFHFACRNLNSEKSS